MPATRIVALLLVAAAAAGLLVVRSGRDPHRVTVPAGAHAGQLDLHACDYRGRPADCGTLVVRENRHDPRSRLIALPVTRVRARSADPGAPIFRLEGGPGLSNMDFPFANRYTARHDVVMVGYRGVDGSSRLDCPEVADQIGRPRDLLSAAYQDAVATAFRECATRLEHAGADLAGYTLPQRVDDLEQARRAFGYGPVDLLSESAGTRTAMVYSWRHPASVHRSVMVGVNPPGHYVWDGRTTDALIARYGRGLAATMRRQADRLPDRWGFLPIHAGNVKVASFFGLMHATPAAAPMDAPHTFQSWTAGAKGDPGGFWLQSLLANLVFPHTQVWGDVAAFGRADVSAARRQLAKPDHSILGNAGSEFLFAGGRVLDAWPANADDDAYDTVPDSGTDTLVVNGALDAATPAVNAHRELLPHLRDGHEVVLPGFGHTADFWNTQAAAGTRLIDTFFDRGRVDASGYHAQPVDWTIDRSLPSMARFVRVLLLGLPVVLVVALAGVASGVARRERLGTVAAAAARSVVAAVAGVAGWVTAVLVILTLALPVTVDAEPVVLLAAGLPVAAAVFGGWVDRRDPRGILGAGAVAAVAAAVLGAWLGYGAGAPPIAPLTAVVGAVAAANLALIALDVALGGARPPVPTAPPPSRRQAVATGCQPEGSAA